MLGTWLAIGLFVLNLFKNIEIFPVPDAKLFLDDEEYDIVIQACTSAA